MKNKVFIDGKLPFLELRYIPQVLSCDKKHQHEELTLTAIKKGEININFEDKIDILVPDVLSVINPHEVHCANLTHIKSYSCYVIYLEKNWCINIQNELFKSKQDFIPFEKSLIKNSLIFDEFIQLCDHILVSEASILEIEEKLIDLMEKLFSRYCSNICLINTEESNSKLALEIKDYLEQSFDEDILLGDISVEFNLSVVHILRVFKKEFGLPIHSFVLNKKVHHAKKLLSQNLPITEVALQSGFFDQSHLNRSFKRVFQLTPKEYQKNILA